MYSNEQSRINAVICYFFLGPFILFAKKDTPLGEHYVQLHAREASKIIAAMLILVTLYFFIRRYINIGIPGIGISVSTIVLTGIVGLTLFFLARGAYLAFQGNTPGEHVASPVQKFPNIEVSGVYTVQSEEEKSRILASMIPFIGIWITKKYNLPVMSRGRALGSLFAFIYILSLFFSSDVGFIPTIILILGIVLFVIEGIYLFLYNSFVSWNIIDKIPTYNEVESHIHAISRSVLEFFKVAFGKTKTGTYGDYFAEALSEINTLEKHTEKYFMPAGLIGVPFWNIFTVPSLFITKYRAYRRVVIEGLIITLVFSFFFFWRKEFTSPYLLLMLFPIVHILVYADDGINIHTPGIGLITQLFHFAKNTQTSIKESMGPNKETFTYDTSQAAPEKIGDGK